jgi:hypothetical protein
MTALSVVGDILLRGLLVAVLSVAAAGKGKDFRSFRSTLIQLGIPRSLTTGVGVGVITIEAVLGYALAVGSNSQWAAMTATLLFLMFAGISLFVERSGRTVPCGCFGSGDLDLGTVTAVRSALLAMASALLALLLIAPPIASNLTEVPAVALAVVFSAAVWLSSWRRAGRPEGYR